MSKVRKDKYKFHKTCQIEGLEKIYADHFPLKKMGTFVEIGAFDGETHSNTSGLADRGWRGIYVEPVPSYAAQCIRRHKENDVLVLKYLVGSSAEHNVKVNVAGELSTKMDDPASMYDQAGLSALYREENLHKTIEVDQLTLDTILHMCNVAPGFDLLVLDCEGAEWDVLTSFDIKRYRPRMVIIEMHEDSVEWQSIPIINLTTRTINAFMKSYGYDKIHQDPINTIFYK